MKVSGIGRVELVRSYSYIVKYYDHNGRQIGYTTATTSNLSEMEGQKIWCGKKVYKSITVKK